MALSDDLLQGCRRYLKGKMKGPSFPLLVCMVAMVLANSPAWSKDSSCQFRAKGLSLSFGELDPSSNAAVNVPVVASTPFASMAGDCNIGSTMAIGIVGSSSRQLVKGPDTINYTITGFPITLPQPGNAPPGNPGNGYTTWFTANQLQGSIQWSAYANAPAGNYSDSVTILITP
ncbi:MAG: hypothetical protein JWR68_3340 [Polaromonas sp.]|nr:hypothetical protein [Polaromonas sp.]